MASAVVKSNNPSFSNNPWIVAQRRKKKKFSLGSRDAEIPVTEDDDDNGYIPTRSASFNTPRNNSQYNRGPTSPTLRYSKTSDQPVQAGTHGRSKNSNSIHTMGKNNNNSNDENKSSKKTIHYTNGRKNTDSDLSIEEKRRLKQNIIKKQREKHEKVSTKDDKNKFVYSSVPKASHSANDPARNGNNRKNTKTSDRGPNRGRTKSSTNRYSTNPRVHSPLRTGTTPTGTSDSEYKSDSESLASSSMNSLNSTNTPTPSSPAISSSSKKSKNLKSGNKTSGARGRTRSKSFKLGNYSPAAPILAAGGLSTHDYNPDNAFMDTTRNSREKNKNENKNKNKKENNNNNTGNRYSKTRSPVSGATTPKKHVLSSLTMEEYTNLQAQKNTEIRSKNEAKAKARSKWPPVKTNNNYSRTGSSRNINNSGARKNSNTNNKNNTNNTSSNKQADSNARKNSNNNNDNSNNNSNNSNNSSNNNNEKKEEEFKYQLTRPMGFSQYQNQFRKHGSGQNVLPSKDKQRSSVSMATIKANPFKIQGVDTDTNNNSKNVRYEMENDNKVGRMSNKQINAVCGIFCIFLCFFVFFRFVCVSVIQYPFFFSHVVVVIVLYKLFRLFVNH